MWLPIAGMAVMLATAPAQSAEAPSFDRPGIGFGTATLRVGGFAWEQGLPDFESSRQDGVHTRLYTANTLLRLGVGERLEVQLGIDAWQRLRIEGPEERLHAEGSGDTGVGLKWALPWGAEAFTWAILASTKAASGKPLLTDDDHRYDIGLTTEWELGEGRAIALYLDRSFGDQRSWTLSPAYSFALTETLGAYVEAGVSTGDDHSRAAGAGLTWRPLPRLQLDLSALRGLDRDSTDWQGGFGVSVYFP
ncbi:outer membrane putative beta-barrel porin/alpha-amylase [Luteimonas cucumeris]|uniref:Outer membrane putative beta-barrel porin/alpha-amylase n=2 Tax=Luteimonas cucumeris TaxID=985012 RepID=A0A562L831_9GAMM|nr:outer membrane putative beta-barrel porin/alpha-amylase [Luteimonas cucumeris]